MLRSLLSKLDLSFIDIVRYAISQTRASALAAIWEVRFEIKNLLDEPLNEFHSEQSYLFVLASHAKRTRVSRKKNILHRVAGSVSCANK